MVEVEQANFGRAGATAIQFFYVSNGQTILILIKFIFIAAY
jgi:hypothetical protein